MDLAVEKSACGQDHCPSPKANAHLRYSPHHTVALKHEVVHRLLKQPEPGLVFQAAANGGLVQHAVGLGPGRTHCGALAGVENPELDAALVGGQRHGTAHGVDLLDQMPLADAADRRVAAHLAQRLNVVGEQQSLAAHAGRSQGGFGARMAPANHDDVKFLRVGVSEHAEVLGKTGSAGRSGSLEIDRPGPAGCPAWLRMPA